MKQTIDSSVFIYYLIQYDCDEYYRNDSLSAMEILEQALNAEHPFALLRSMGNRITAEEYAYLEQNGNAVSIEINFDKNDFVVACNDDFKQYNLCDKDLQLFEEEWAGTQAVKNDSEDEYELEM